MLILKADCAHADQSDHDYSMKQRLNLGSSALAVVSLILRCQTGFADSLIVSSAIDGMANLTRQALEVNRRPSLIRRLLA